MKIYFISGLGANKQAFKNLKIPNGFEPVFLDWKIPEPNEDLQHYAQRMSDKINPNEPFHLVGLSFGGIVVQEINQFLKSDKTILISTIKNRSEMPLFMKFSSKFNVHKAIPYNFFVSDKILSYAFFRRLYDPRLPKLSDFFTEKNPYYLRWSMDKIVNWDNNFKNHNQLYHMHGNKDIIFPISKIKNADIIDGGTHLMVIQKHKEVSNLLSKYLLE